MLGQTQRAQHAAASPRLNTAILEALGKSDAMVNFLGFHKVLKLRESRCWAEVARLAPPHSHMRGTGLI